MIIEIDEDLESCLYSSQYIELIAKEINMIANVFPIQSLALFYVSSKCAKIRHVSTQILHSFNLT